MGLDPRAPDGPADVRALDLGSDVVTLTQALVDMDSVSGNERAIADAVELALRDQPHLSVMRLGNTVVARTELGRAERVVIAGHLDTVPLNDNLPSVLDGDFLRGLGACDMKGGDAVALKLATIPDPSRDVTFVFYDCEEVEAARNGLNNLAASEPSVFDADFAILMEPSNGNVEAGCQGTMRFEVTVRGERAHSARGWAGVNAIHRAAPVLDRLNSYEPRRPLIDGLEYHEGLNAVFVRGGVAGNVVPDECVVTINFRFAPDRSEADAEAFVRELFEGFELLVTDSAPGALPGLSMPAAKAFIEAVAAVPAPKFGWTDVARFAALGIPAVNYGPGDPMLAHKQEEHVPVSQLRDVEAALRKWLS